MWKDGTFGFLFISYHSFVVVVVVVVDPYEIHMDICNESCSGGTAAFHDGNLNVGHYTESIQLILFIQAMLTGTIYFYHFMSLSLVLI